ncbi:MAG TPA: hypothetical protein VHF69_05005 [Candidatus Synoicihabitans sp.]|nr:hypothetical protein [Candidatus Synoicihabitans sp.]
MRDHERYDEDLDIAHENGRRRRTALDTIESVLLLGALALIAMPAIKGIARRYRVQHPAAADEQEVDKSLKDTYPASDPPAARYVDIPVNRR